MFPHLWIKKIEMHDLYCSFPFCPPNIRTSQPCAYHPCPPPPVDTWNTTNNNEIVQLRRPLGGIPRCSGCAFQGSPLQPVAPGHLHCLSFPSADTVGFLKLLLENLSPLRFPVWRWRQRDVSDEKIEHRGWWNLMELKRMSRNLRTKER